MLVAYDRCQLTDLLGAPLKRADKFTSARIAALSDAEFVDLLVPKVRRTLCVCVLCVCVSVFVCVFGCVCVVLCWFVVHMHARVHWAYVAVYVCSIYTPTHAPQDGADADLPQAAREARALELLPADARERLCAAMAVQMAEDEEAFSRAMNEFDRQQSERTKKEVEKREKFRAGVPDMEDIGSKAAKSPHVVAKVTKRCGLRSIRNYRTAAL